MQAPNLKQIAANLTEVTQGQITLYFSYQTVIAIHDGRKLYLSENVYSKTTGRHINTIAVMYGRDRTSPRMPRAEFDSLLDAIFDNGSDAFFPTLCNLAKYDSVVYQA